MWGASLRSINLVIFVPTNVCNLAKNCRISSSVKGRMLDNRSRMQWRVRAQQRKQSDLPLNLDRPVSPRIWAHPTVSVFWVSETCARFRCYFQGFFSASFLGFVPSSVGKFVIHACQHYLIPSRNHQSLRSADDGKSDGNAIRECRLHNSIILQASNQFQ